MRGGAEDGVGQEIATKCGKVVRSAVAKTDDPGSNPESFQGVRTVFHGSMFSFQIDMHCLQVHTQVSIFFIIGPYVCRAITGRGKKSIFL
jgi:hypothetical protein